MTRPTLYRLLFSATLVAAHALPLEANACGGTFCDAGPQVMPVDQRGENILFVMQDGWVEAHVQIQYTGDPAKFAWIVPVMAMPEISAGSDPLFANLLAGTVPTFTLDTRFEDCDGGGGGLGCMMFAASDAAAGEFDESADGGVDPDAPDVVARGIAGAFEYAVLEGGTVDGVVRWLDDNDYAQDDDAPSILEEYLDEDFLFVAFKLQGGTGVDEIHPVRIRYQGDEPCVPIRLTRIAAEPDMGVRVFFLGEHRVVPTNYRNVEINPLLIDWVNLGANYMDLVTQAVDTPGSDGHGFVTEYAGPSDVVPTDGIHSGRWSAERFLGIDPTLVVDELRAQQLMRCANGACTYDHPLLLGTLARFVPRPVGVTEDEFYDCLSCYAEEIDLEAWSDTGFAEALAERIIEPARHALDLLEAHPYLTRMFTTLSPHEMTKDPFFHANADLPDVSNAFRATRVFVCDGSDYIELEDGRRMAIDPANTLPDDMPWADRVEEIPEHGAPMTVVELDEDIEDARRAWNAQHGLDDDGGCNCRSSKRRWDGALWMSLAFGFAWIASRRRRS